MVWPCMIDSTQSYSATQTHTYTYAQIFMCICNATWHMQLLTHQTVVAGACGKLLSVDDLIDHSAMPRRVQQTIYAYIQISAQPRGITNLPSFITSFTRSYCVCFFFLFFIFCLCFCSGIFIPPSCCCSASPSQLSRT